MDKQRFNAYKKFIEDHGKANLTQLVTYTASNEFITKRFLTELIKSGLIDKKGCYYYLNKKGVNLWESKL